jgi:hypothetical protein
MSSQVTCVYRVARGGLSDSALRTAVAAVSVKNSIGDVLSTLGLRVISDSTVTAGAFAVRTIVFTWLPSASATMAAATINADGQLNPITVTAPGADYVLPPIALAGGGPPYKNAILRSWLKVVGSTIAAPGSGYSAATFATVIGQLAPSKPNARQAKLGLTIVAGAINAVTIADAGSGYVGIPVVTITDPGVTPGSGGEVDLSMGVDEVEVVYPGQGFQSAPTILLLPAFESSFVGSEDKPFFNLMTSAIQQAILSPVSADAPIVS